jgi:hypothetical protein
MGGTLAGDEDIVAELSSIDPKVTEFCFDVPTLPREGMLIPSFMATPF